VVRAFGLHDSRYAETGETGWPSSMSEVPDSIAWREQLEDSWRLKLEIAFNLYTVATTECRKMQQAHSESGAHDGVVPPPLVRARHEESQALAYYVRVLRIFTDLTVHGKLPPDADLSDTRGT